MGVISKRVTGCVKFVGTSLVRAMSRKVHEHENDKDSVCCRICFDISALFFEGVEGLAMEHHTDH